MRPLRIILIVVGSLLVVGGAGLLVGGAVLGWAYGTQRDDAGFFTTGSERFETPTYAITSQAIDLGRGSGDWFVERGDLATVRLDITGEGRDLFVGIGPERDVDAYLDGVAHDDLRDVDFSPFNARYDRQPGTRAPASPGQQGFWAASVSGPGPQTLTWDLERGRWKVVVMNADASSGVVADLGIGARLGFLLPIIVGLTVGGIVLAATGTGLVVAGALARERPPAAPPSPPPSGSPPGTPPEQPHLTR